MILPSERSMHFDSGGLRIEAILHDGDGRLCAVVLHPHPQYGGDMHNHVVGALCGAFAGEGATTLRFNFRGTGASEGTHDHGRGEAADALAAVAVVRAEAPAAPIVLAGYSVGAAIAAAVAEDAAVSALVLVSPPLGYESLPPLPSRLPALVVAGDRDHVAPAEAVRALAAGHVRVEIVEGVDHGWWGGLHALTEYVRSFVASLDHAT